MDNCVTWGAVLWYVIGSTALAAVVILGAIAWYWFQDRRST